VVIADSGFDGLVVRLGGSFAEISIEGDKVGAGGAVALPVLARASVKAGRGGLEWCVGVPGSVGGAVRMNAGCHGTDIAACLEAATVINLRSGDVSRRSPVELGLGYRHSDLGPDDLVAAADFNTTEIDPEDGDAELRRITKWRRDNQPGGTLNAGSVFKNPPDDAAGRIIDEAGLKGYELGRVRVSPRHANFFEAEPGATAQEVHDLVFAVRDLVAEKTGVTLQPEIRFVGDFG